MNNMVNVVMMIIRESTRVHVHVYCHMMIVCLAK